MENFFDQAYAVEWEEVAHSFHHEVEKDHGRIDTREVRVVEDLDWLSNAGKWKNLACLVEVRSTRQKTRSAISETFRRYIFRAVEHLLKILLNGSDSIGTLRTTVIGWLM